jgi:hypothetical protein
MGGRLCLRLWDGIDSATLYLQAKSQLFPTDLDERDDLLILKASLGV